jgi:hypothetical protein
VLGALQHARWGPDRLVDLVPGPLKTALGVGLAVCVARRALRGTVVGGEARLLADFLKGRIAAHRR